jgi:peptidoglycan/xylan/chitin deacetylase (PgdA/CDA1 family)
MSSFENVTIGAHSFGHQNLSKSRLSVPQLVEFIEQDTAKTCEWFRETLGGVPTKFCYPYNNSMYGMYTEILQKHGFTEFYGAERMDAAWLTDPPDWIIPLVWNT